MSKPLHDCPAHSAAAELAWEIEHVVRAHAAKTGGEINDLVALGALGLVSARFLAALPQADAGRRIERLTRDIRFNSQAMRTDGNAIGIAMHSTGC